jgi:glucose-6-phosphate isomerase
MPAAPFGAEDLARVTEVLSELSTDPQCINLFDAKVDVAYINRLADTIKAEFKTLIIIGTGASSIVPRVFFSFASHGKIKTRFLEDLDSLKLDEVLSSIDPKFTCFLVISKSGCTREVLELISVCSAWLESKLGDDIGKHFYCMTQTHSKNPLLALIRKYNGITIIDHPNTCGRYAFFSCLGMLPAALAGFNIELILRLAVRMTSGAEKGSQILNSVAYFIKMSEKYSNVVFMTYSSLFCGLALWFRQLISESLGKHGGGLNPVIFEGSIDQHSQLQAYVDGLPDKFFVLIMPSLKLCESIMTSGQLNLLKEDTVRNLWKINYSQIKAVLNLLVGSRKNIQVIEVNAIDEQFIASIASCFILQTVLYAKLNKMDPFSQSAVDSMKSLAFPS